MRFWKAKSQKNVKDDESEDSILNKEESRGEKTEELVERKRNWRREIERKSKGNWYLWYKKLIGEITRKRGHDSDWQEQK